MTKIIQTQETSGSGPRIVTVPGIRGYASRYVAAHLDLEAGAQVTAWPGTSAGAPLTVSVNPPTITLEDDGDYYVTSTGGKRLLGTHTSQRPFTIAAVVKTEPGFHCLGMAGVEIGRNAAGFWYQRSSTGATVTTTDASAGWTLVIMTAHADSTHSVSINGVTTSKVALGAAPPTYGGLYFGGDTAGQVTSVREIVCWHSDLTAGGRDKASKYLRERYADLRNPIGAEGLSLPGLVDAAVGEALQRADLPATVASVVAAQPAVTAAAAAAVDVNPKITKIEASIPQVLSDAKTYADAEVTKDRTRLTGIENVAIPKALTDAKTYADAAKLAAVEASFGPKVISYDAITGRPYWDETNGIHRIFTRYDGRPYAALTPDITTSTPAGRPALNI